MSTKVVRLSSALGPRQTSVLRASLGGSKVELQPTIQIRTTHSVPKYMK